MLMPSPKRYQMKPEHIQRFLDEAALVSSWSKIETTKVGCVLVAPDQTFIVGFNGPPRGFDDSLIPQLSREHLRAITTHAEINAIANAARSGFKTIGTTAFVTHPVCSQCMGALINAGVSEVYFSGKLHPDWFESTELGVWLAGSCGVAVVFLNPPDSEKD